MDREGNRTEDLDAALRDIELTNRWLGGRSAMLAAIEPFLTETTGPLEILDVGTGGGDIPQAIVDHARCLGREASVVGFDLDPVTVGLAARRLGRSAGVRLVRGDAWRLPFVERSFDLVVASMFLHHFGDAEVVDLLKRFRRIARRAVVINDLRRNLVPYLFISVVSRLAARHPMYVHDAPLSVLRGFTRDELHRAADATGARRFELRRHWPYRLVLILPADDVP
jgi:2-polyprenyl-3-methyl-5-hydroxy-6-metoxy-1,4-benzoquinol methylase